MPIGCPLGSSLGSRLRRLNFPGVQSPRLGGAVLLRLRGRGARERGASLRTPRRHPPTQQRRAPWSARLGASNATSPTLSQPCAATSSKPCCHGHPSPWPTQCLPNSAEESQNHARVGIRRSQYVSTDRSRPRGHWSSTPSPYTRCRSLSCRAREPSHR